ncbi:MAG: hypothetical protein IIC57_11415, partial [Proteobacteria bacterium]|nr:hypothetical protein [Pseudomonadota bacterium]
MEPKLWYRDEVRFRLEEAAETLKAQSLSIRDMPSGRVTAWPDVVHDAIVAYGYAPVRMRPAAPTPAKISRADEAVQWLFWLSDRERKIVWARACRISWRRLAAIDGRSHPTLRKIFAGGLDAILRNLNATLSHDEACASPSAACPGWGTPWRRRGRGRTLRRAREAGPPAGRWGRRPR